jgi:GAF domain-containing protein
VSDATDRAAAAADVLGGDERHEALLQSIADVARALFRAEAATIFLLDGSGRDLIFAAISGRGEHELIGSRIPATTGIAGWTLTTREPLAVADLANEPRFARQQAEAIGYVPDALVAMPILHQDVAVGVLEVLDPGLGRPVGQGDLAMLGLFADQAAIALEIARTSSAPPAAVEAVAAALAAHPDRERWLPVLEALANALRR